jgi:hypothetical protein
VAVDFAALAALFNPTFTAHLDRSLWIVADWFSISAIVIAAFVFWKVSKT